VRGRALAALITLAGVAGCPAKPVLPPGPDLSVGSDMFMMMEPPPPDDMAVARDMECAVQGPELCNNNCDDDRNGYVDGQDPACTGGQVLVTLAINPPMTTTGLFRWLFWPMPNLQILDGNPTGPGAMATYDRKFSSSAYLALDDGSRALKRLTLDGGVILSPTPGYAIRDVCIFRNELIVVEPGGMLHRFKADAVTELPSPVAVNGTLSACSSDGTNLYVSRSIGGGTSEIVIITPDEFAKGDTSMSTVRALPDSVVNGFCCDSCVACDRLIDLAYVPQSGLFVGLFADSVLGTKADDQLDSNVVTMFALDGGVTGPIDFGSYHGVGEFRP
jgi:hypothetical protein